MKSAKSKKISKPRAHYAQLPNSGLAAFLGRIKEGNTDVYRTKFYNNSQSHKDVAKILGDWDIQLRSIKEQYPEMYAFECDLRKKVGPLSVMKPLDDRMDDIRHYYDDILLPSEPIHRRAVAAVVSEWGPPNRGLEIRSRDDTIEKMKKSTNSGLPFFANKKEVLDATEHVTSYDHSGIYSYRMKPGTEFESGYYKRCAVLGWRGQEGGPEDDDVKQRVIWMVDMEDQIRELQVYQPLIEHCQHYNHVPAWVSMDSVDAEVTKLFDTKDPDDLVVCTDFQKFDQHFNGDMAEAAREIIFQMFSKGNTFRDWEYPKTDIVNWLRDIFPVKYTIPLMIQLDMVKTGDHGMASGSGGTNADETLAHRALQHEAAMLNHAKLNPHSMCLGDDGILSYPGITVDDVMDVYTSHGQEMNADKQYASKHDCVYLRRWHGTNYRVDGVCVGVYSTMRALGRLMYQERFYDSNKWSNRMVALRQLSIIENCKYHPLFEEFVKYCMKGDKYRLGIDIPGFLDDIDSIANEARSWMPDFLGYTKTLDYDNDKLGIKSWRVVQFLSSLKK